MKSRFWNQRTLWSLVAGFLLTVATSWLCAFSFYRVEREELEFTVRNVDRAAFAWPGPVPARWTRNPIPVDAVPARQYRLSLGKLVSITELTYKTAAVQHPITEAFIRTTWGLPFPSLSYDRLWTASPFGNPTFANQATMPHRGFEFYGFDGNVPRAEFLEVAIFPLMPWWPGFVLNTLFYAACSWLLAAGLARFRASRRLSRGQCPKCKYPIGTTPVCSECGFAVPGHLAKPTGERV